MILIDSYIMAFEILALSVVMYDMIKQVGGILSMAKMYEHQ